MPETGMYRVIHYRHRAPHVNILLEGQEFPKCNRCAAKVRFLFLSAVPQVPETHHCNDAPHVLVVEHEPSEAQKLKRELEADGYRIRVADSYSEAVNLLDAWEFDAVLADVSLGEDGRGLELARTAKSLDPAPLIMLSTAEPTETKLRAAMRLGINYFLLKPINVTELRSALYRMINRRASGMEAPGS